MADEANYRINALNRQHETNPLVPSPQRKARRRKRRRRPKRAAAEQQEPDDAEAPQNGQDQQEGSGDHAVDHYA